jgi:hypothetical protein
MLGHWLLGNASVRPGNGKISRAAGKARGGYLFFGLKSR